MAVKKPQDRVCVEMRALEKLAKRVRTDIRKRAQGGALAKNIQSAANQLRKRAAAAVAQLEKYVHELRKELEGAPKKPVAKKVKRRKRKARGAPTVSA